MCVFSALIVDCLNGLIPVLSAQMLEAVKGPVYGLTYEKGDSDILMAGYKLAAAKLTASSAIGCLAQHVCEPEELGKVSLTTHLLLTHLLLDRWCYLVLTWVFRLGKRVPQLQPKCVTVQGTVSHALLRPRLQPLLCPCRRRLGVRPALVQRAAMS